jgi:hypothetical protein
MKIVFKVIAIIGILRFFGALKDGVFFFIGLILAGVLGYFAWSQVKNKFYKKSNNSEQINLYLDSKSKNELQNAFEIVKNKNSNFLKYEFLFLMIVVLGSLYLIFFKFSDVFNVF